MKKMGFLKESKIDTPKNKLSKLNLSQSQGPFLGLADWKSSSPYKKHFMYGSMSGLREGKALNFQNTRNDNHSLGISQNEKESKKILVESKPGLMGISNFYA